jgi:hypothetical protein
MRNTQPIIHAPQSYNDASRKNHDAIPKECIPIGTKPIVDQENSDFFTSAKQYFISTQ